jgi:hypothetical protein
LTPGFIQSPVSSLPMAIADHPQGIVMESWSHLSEVTEHSTDDPPVDQFWLGGDVSD